VFSEGLVRRLSDAMLVQYESESSVSAGITAVDAVVSREGRLHATQRVRGSSCTVLRAGDRQKYLPCRLGLFLLHACDDACLVCSS